MSSDEVSTPNVSPYLVRHRRSSKLTSAFLIVLVCYLQQMRHGERVDRSVLTNASGCRAVDDICNRKLGCIRAVVLMLSVFFMFFMHLAMIMFVCS